MLWYKPIVEVFKGRRVADRRWMANCPAHEDERPSLGIMLSRKGGALLIKCFAGCDTKNILSKVGLHMRDLFSDSTKKVHDTPYVFSKKVNAIYPYEDEEGRILYEKIRYEPKDFSMRVPNCNGTYSYSMEGVRRVPFNLPLIRSDPNKGVYLVEGEKDALAISELGLIGTCITEGAGGGGWNTKYYGQFFKHRSVLVIPDNDEPGIRHAMGAVGVLIACGVKRVAIAKCTESLPGHGDISDLIDHCKSNGGTQQDIRVMLSGIANSVNWYTTGGISSEECTQRRENFSK